MATKAKASEPKTADAQPVADPHEGEAWAHDWRNPDATFAADDHCVNAEMHRLSKRQVTATA